MNLQFAPCGGGQAVVFELEAPTECPKCHVGIVAIGVGNSGFTWQTPADRFAMYLFACPRENCRNGFVALWAHDTPANRWSPRGVFPSAVQPSVNPASSKAFRQLFTQSSIKPAKQSNVNFRKLPEWVFGRR